MVGKNRARRLADLVTGYSLGLHEGDIFLIEAEAGFDYHVRQLERSAKRRGAKVIHYAYDLKEKRKLIRACDDNELAKERDRLCSLANQATAFMWVDATKNPEYLRGVNQDNIARYEEEVEDPYVDIREKSNRWVGVAYPSEANAKRTGMSLRKYTDFLYSIILGVDYARLRKKMGQIKGRFDNAKDVHIFVPGQTDLHLSLEGRGGEICDGHFNLPDGEIEWGPVENSAEGFFYSPYSIIYDGNELGGIKVVLRRGQIVDFSAKKGRRLLEAIFNEENARFLGEFGIGCNDRIEQEEGDVIVLEKKKKSVHIAPGGAFIGQPLECGGGLNDSPVHLDLVCDLSKGGELYVDGQLVQKNGLWTFK